MTPYIIREVSASDHAETIDSFNRLDPIFPLLQDRHFLHGFWWLAYCNDVAVAFAGLVPMTPFEGYGYLKRAYVLPEHRGRGLQRRLLSVRELKARDVGWTHLVSECSGDNVPSANNFARAGYTPCRPEQPWGVPDSIYWIKKL